MLAKNNPLQQGHQPSAEEEAKRLRRLRRFEDDAAQFKADNVSTPMQLMSLVRDQFKLLLAFTDPNYRTAMTLIILL